ncbi:MAG: urea carboxylase-associated family protein [Chloroflexi bacterium]|nr:urea carboxylase-associated family protein [Chloroflexota bacterium]
MKIVEEFVIPKCTGKAFRLDRGRVLRVIEPEGGQVAGLMFFNAHNYKEQFMAEFSGSLSRFTGLGTRYAMGKLFSKVPFENLMLTVTDDKVGKHFAGPHCTTRMMALLKAPGHRSCTDNFTDALREFGLELQDVYSPSVFNAFMNAHIDPEREGTITYGPPTGKKGDYIEFRAEMDVLVAVSACPDDVSEVNGHVCKEILIQVLA